MTPPSTTRVSGSKVRCRMLKRPTSSTRVTRNPIHPRPAGVDAGVLVPIQPLAELPPDRPPRRRRDTSRPPRRGTRHVARTSRVRHPMRDAIGQRRVLDLRALGLVVHTHEKVGARGWVLTRGDQPVSLLVGEWIHPIRTRVTVDAQRPCQRPRTTRALSVVLPTRPVVEGSVVPRAECGAWLQTRRDLDVASPCGDEGAKPVGAARWRRGNEEHEIIPAVAV
jgi:hypothetical protein